MITGIVVLLISFFLFWKEVFYFLPEHIIIARITVLVIICMMILGGLVTTGVLP